MNLIFDALSDLGQTRKARKSALMLGEGDMVAGFFWLRKGSVRVYQMSSDAKELEVARFREQQWIAPAIALSADRFPYFMQAVEKCEYVFFPKAKAWERIVSQPALASFFLNLLADRCRSLHQRLHALQFQTLRERILQYLLQECPHDGSCSIHLPLTKKDLASLLGVTPEALSRALSGMVEEKMIAMDGKNIRVLQCGRSCYFK
jgi:CRP/FNR family transcriptional regulator